MLSSRRKHVPICYLTAQHPFRGDVSLSNPTPQDGAKLVGIADKVLGTNARDTFLGNLVGINIREFSPQS